jgi:tyrosyl-tRNA synthetase
MQAYDFLELARRHGCQLQLGGSDQWGNIVNGVELGRRAEGRELYGLTTPLITTSSGAKMGKTAAGAVWLNEDRLPAFDYWQYWRNVDDADVGRFLRLFTELPLAEIERLEALQGAELNEAKKVLAFEATKLCRGEAAATAASETARELFETRVASGALQAGQSIVSGAAEVYTPIPRADFEQGVSVVDLFRRSQLVASNGEARRLIRGGGARVNEERVEDESRIVRMDDLKEGRLLLSAGKKRYAWIRAV